MLPKKNRLSAKEVRQLFKGGSFLSSHDITFKYLKSNNKTAKISFIASKNIAKLAIKRNMLRRQGYLALAKYINQFPIGITGVFIFKKYQDNILALEDEIKNIFDKIN